MVRLFPRIAAGWAVGLVLFSQAAWAWEGSVSDFGHKSCGGREGRFWNLWSTGEASQWLEFPETGEYEIEIEAYGSEARGVRPLMRVSVGLEPLKRFSVDGRRGRHYTLFAAIEKGSRRLSISFLNDYYSPDRSEDRNLYLGKVKVLARSEGGSHPTLSGPPDWRAEAEERISAHRKGDLVIRLGGEGGVPLAGIPVRVKLIRHAFPFGCAVSTGFVRRGWKAADRDRYGALFSELFNHAVPENALKWGQVNREGPESDYSSFDAILAWCKSKGIPVRGHCILWASEKRVPAYARKLDDGGLRGAVLTRIGEVLERYRGQVAEHDLNNEMIHVDYFARRLGMDFRAEMFRRAREVDPDAVLYVNDFNILSGRDLERYVSHIEDLLGAGASVGGIGVQGHFGGRIPDPVTLKMVLDRLARFRLPIKITEFDMDTPDEGRQALGLYDFYKLCFSHPSVEGVLMWGFWARAHWRPRGALFDENWRAKPAAEAYRRLLFDEWRTRTPGRTNERGLFSSRAFYGRYEVTITRKGGAPLKKVVEFPREASGKVIRLAVE
ncbi:MAG: endo-1,4-beta-xylanase [Planctomycetota bacterium]|jgi:GH35 family endo-1,4-beta-xylanase